MEGEIIWKIAAKEDVPREIAIFVGRVKGCQKSFVNNRPIKMSRVIAKTRVRVPARPGVRLIEIVTSPYGAFRVDIERVLNLDVCRDIPQVLVAIDGSRNIRALKERSFFAMPLVKSLCHAGAETMQEARDAAFSGFLKQKMKMILNKTEGVKENMRVAFRPVRGSFKRSVSVSVFQIAIPVRRNERVIKVRQHKQESESILVIANDREAARAALDDMDERPDTERLFPHLMNILTYIEGR